MISVFNLLNLEHYALVNYLGEPLNAFNLGGMETRPVQQPLGAYACNLHETLNQSGCLPLGQRMRARAHRSRLCWKRVSLLRVCRYLSMVRE